MGKAISNKRTWFNHQVDRVTVTSVTLLCRWKHMLISCWSWLLPVVTWNIPWVWGTPLHWKCCNKYADLGHAKPMPFWEMWLTPECHVTWPSIFQACALASMEHMASECIYLLFIFFQWPMEFEGNLARYQYVFQVTSIIKKTTRNQGTCKRHVFREINNLPQSLTSSCFRGKASNLHGLSMFFTSHIATA